MAYLPYLLNLLDYPDTYEGYINFFLKIKEDCKGVEFVEAEAGMSIHGNEFHSNEFFETLRLSSGAQSGKILMCSDSFGYSFWTLPNSITHASFGNLDYANAGHTGFESPSGAQNKINDITLVPNGADTIDGVAACVINSGNASVTLIADGTSDWEVV